MWNQSSLDNSYEIYEGMHFHLDVLKVISIVVSFTRVDPEDLSVKEENVHHMRMMKVMQVIITNDVDISQTIWPRIYPYKKRKGIHVYVIISLTVLPLHT